MYKVLCDARAKLRIAWRNEANQKHMEMILEAGPNLDTVAFSGYVGALGALWGDEAINIAYSKRADFQLSDSVAYFYNNLERIAKISFIPCDIDILHARQATKAIMEYKMSINQVPFLFVDVGGQRTQRQKWFKCFHSVTSIIFIASSSEYDQKIAEDRSTNRLEESLNIFDTVVNNSNFRDTSIILFLNKTDLLIKKVRSLRSNIAQHFSDFKVFLIFIQKYFFIVQCFSDFYGIFYFYLKVIFYCITFL